MAVAAWRGVIGGGAVEMGIKPSVHSGRALGKKHSTDTMTSTSQEEDGSKYILHEEWLADVCGVSRRRSVGILRWLSMLSVKKDDAGQSSIHLSYAISNTLCLYIV